MLKRLNLKKQVLRTLPYLIISVTVWLAGGTADSAPLSGLIMHEEYADFTNAALENVIWDETGEFPGFLLTPEGVSAGKGIITSSPLRAEFPFNNVVPSWNILAPEGTGAVIELRTSEDGQEWTGWFQIAAWRTKSSAGKRGLTPSGKVDADMLVLYKYHNFIQYRITLIAQAGLSPRLRLVALSYADTKQSAPAATTSTPTSGSGRHLNVPYRSQRHANPAIASRVCSPTSLAMVLDYYGFDFSTDDVAAMAYDKANDIYGNWPFNTAVAGSLGLEAFVARFADFGPIEREVAAGHPVIISIRFGYGELAGAPISLSNGHLVVVTGFTDNGDVMVNDPAGDSESTGRVIYKREELQKAWKNGVAYIIRPGNE